MPESTLQEPTEALWSSSEADVVHDAREYVKVFLRSYAANTQFIVSRIQHHWHRLEGGKRFVDLLHAESQAQEQAQFVQRLNP